MISPQLTASVILAFIGYCVGGYWYINQDSISLVGKVVVGTVVGILVAPILAILFITAIAG